MEMEHPSFDEFAEFIRKLAKLPRKKPIAPETEFEDGLGITGDDGCELLQAVETHYGVSLSSKEDGYRKAFNLGPNEFLFHSEGLLPDLLCKPPAFVVEFTLGDLYNALKEALKIKTRD